MPTLSFESHKFVWKGTFDDRVHAQRSNFSFDAKGGVWISDDMYKALRLINFADDSALRILLPVEEAIEASAALSSTISVPAIDGCFYLPFQLAGIENMAKRRVSFLADDMGVGKTIQAIGLSNYCGFESNLIIVPASLRIKWFREWTKWAVAPNGFSAQYIVGSNTIWTLASGKNMHALIMSYESAVSRYRELMELGRWDHIILDEAHYLKNPEAKRTKAILGDLFDPDGPPGLISRSDKVTLLSGTPIPNRANEFFPMLRNLVPNVLGKRYMYYGKFLNQFCQWFNGDHGIIVTGSKNEWELGNRLRGSGFMTRRVKSAVLPDLPDKRHILVEMVPDAPIKKILEKEKPFDPEEILRIGAAAFPALPQIRKEMGIAKIKLILEYVKMMLEGVEKVIVGTIHREVAKSLYATFKQDKYNPAIIIGETNLNKRQYAVDKFQTDPTCRVFIGNLQAAGEGHDLTASSEVILAEPDWSPHRNNQFIDRSHRKGQKSGVQVHYLVVSGSLDAHILSTAIEKESGINKILDGDLNGD